MKKFISKITALALLVSMAPVGAISSVLALTVDEIGDQATDTTIELSVVAEFGDFADAATELTFTADWDTENDAEGEVTVAPVSVDGIDVVAKTFSYTYNTAGTFQAEICANDGTDEECREFEVVVTDTTDLFVADLATEKTVDTVTLNYTLGNEGVNDVLVEAPYTDEDLLALAEAALALQVIVDGVEDDAGTDDVDEEVEGLEALALRLEALEAAAVALELIVTGVEDDDTTDEDETVDPDESPEAAEAAADAREAVDLALADTTFADVAAARTAADAAQTAADDAADTSEAAIAANAEAAANVLLDPEVVVTIDGALEEATSIVDDENSIAYLAAGSSDERSIELAAVGFEAGTDYLFGVCIAEDGVEGETDIDDNCAELTYTHTDGPDLIVDSVTLTPSSLFPALVDAQEDLDAAEAALNNETTGAEAELDAAEAELGDAVAELFSDVNDFRGLVFPIATDSPELSRLEISLEAISSALSDYENLSELELVDLDADIARARLDTVTTAGTQEDFTALEDAVTALEADLDAELLVLFGQTAEELAGAEDAAIALEAIVAAGVEDDDTTEVNETELAAEAAEAAREIADGFADLDAYAAELEILALELEALEDAAIALELIVTGVEDDVDTPEDETVDPDESPEAAEAATLAREAVDLALADTTFADVAAARTAANAAANAAGFAAARTLAEAALAEVEPYFTAAAAFLATADAFEAAAELVDEKLVLRDAAAALVVTETTERDEVKAAAPIDVVRFRVINQGDEPVAMDANGSNSLTFTLEDGTEDGTAYTTEVPWVDEDGDGVYLAAKDTDDDDPLQELNSKIVAVSAHTLVGAGNFVIDLEETIIACADSTGIVAEIEETNNCSDGTFTFTGDTPDLVAIATGFTETDENLVFDYTIQNLGLGIEFNPGGSNEFFLGETGAASSVHEELWADDEDEDGRVSYLVTGNAIPKQFSIAKAGFSETASLDFIVCVDADSVLTDEVDTTNNCSTLTFVRSVASVGGTGGTVSTGGGGSSYVAGSQSNPSRSSGGGSVSLASDDEEEEEQCFPDVKPGDDHYEAIQFLCGEGIVEGYPDGYFKQDDTINRAEMLKIFVEGLGITPDADKYKNCYPDVKEDWYAKYVCYATDEGWVEGYPDGKFRPADETNKVEGIKMLLETHDVDLTKTGTDPYKDVDMGDDWFAPYIKTAKDLGLLEEDGNFYYPGRDMTRGMMSENLYRLIMLDGDRS